MDDCSQWAEDVFGDAELGDVRRTARLVRMAAKAVRRPSGRVSEVYDSAAERQGAYDFLESPHVDMKAIGRAIAASTARQCAQQIRSHGVTRYGARHQLAQEITAGIGNARAVGVQAGGAGQVEGSRAVIVGVVVTAQAH